jgi:hypothetical protein
MFWVPETKLCKDRSQSGNEMFGLCNTELNPGSVFSMGVFFIETKNSGKDFFGN